jgi:hypothetical protein
MRIVRAKSASSNDDEVARCGVPTTPRHTIMSTFDENTWVWIPDEEEIALPAKVCYFWKRHHSTGICFLKSVLK